MAIHEGNTKDVSVSNARFKILAYGAPGSGKTYFGSTMPKPYFISLDGGLLGLSVRKLAVPYVQVDTFEDLTQVLMQIRNVTRAQDRESIIIDHLTALSPLVVDATLRAANKRVMDIGLWGAAKDRLRVLINDFTGLADDPGLKKHFHTCMLSHEQIERDEVRGGTWGTPATIGQFSYYVGGWFDLFLYFEQVTEWKNGKQIPSWVMRSLKYVDYVARDRLGILQPAEENNFQIILDRFKEKTDATD